MSKIIWKPTSDRKHIEPQLQILMESMMDREVVILHGSHDGHDVHVHAVINGVMAEDGSGCNYILTTMTGKKVFVKLDRPGMVQRSGINWGDVK